MLPQQQNYQAHFYRDHVRENVWELLKLGLISVLQPEMDVTLFIQFLNVTF